MKITLTALLLFAFAVVPPAVSQVAISASSVKDAAGHALTARLCFTPVTVSETPIGFRVGSTQVVPNEACGILTAGALASGFTLQPSPSGLYYHLYIKASNSNTVIRDMCIAAITGSTWSLDSFDPNCAAITPESLIMGTVTTLSPGAGGSCTVTGDGFPFVLNCSVPQGVAGAAGPAGPSAVSVNGSSALPAVNLNSSTPSADGGYTAVTWKKDGSGNTIAEVLTSSGSYTLPIATTSTLGGIKPDGTSCTVNSSTGVLSCSGGGGSAVSAGTPYITVGGTSYDANFTAVTKPTGCGEWTSIDVYGDINGNFTCSDSTTSAGYPSMGTTSGDVVFVSGYNTEIQLHELKAVSGKSVYGLDFALTNAGFTHPANGGPWVCDTVDDVMMGFFILGQGSAPPLLQVSVYQADWNGMTKCVGYYAQSGWWNDYNAPTGSPAGPLIATRVLNTTGINLNNAYLRIRYGPNYASTPAWFFEYSLNGRDWIPLGDVCNGTCSVNSVTVGPFTHAGPYFYGGNAGETGNVWGTGEMDIIGEYLF